jgi:hypothetical protein
VGGSSSSSTTKIPRVVWQDDDLAIVYKPAGMSLSGDQRDRAGVSLEAWWQQRTTTGHPSRGRAAGRSVPATAVVTPLHKAVGGLVALAKTCGGYDYLCHNNKKDEMECGYVALVAHHDEECQVVGAHQLAQPLLWDNFTVVSTTPAVLAPYLSLVQFTTFASISTSTVIAALAQMQCPVVGTATAGTPGGVHLVLVDLTLPLLSRRRGGGTDSNDNDTATSHKGPAAAKDAATTTATTRPFMMEFHIEVPKKLAKTQRREMLHAERRRALQQGDTDGISSASSATTITASATATAAICDGDGGDGAATNTTAENEQQQRVLLFMGVRLAVGTDQLRPRPSSQCLVQAATNVLLQRAAVAAAVSSSSSSQQQQQKLQLSVLDIGCGPGSLLLATLHGLAQQLPLQKCTTTTLPPPIEVVGVGIDIDEVALATAWAMTKYS